MFVNISFILCVCVRFVEDAALTNMFNPIRNKNRQIDRFRLKRVLLESHIKTQNGNISMDELSDPFIDEPVGHNKIRKYGFMKRENRMKWKMCEEKESRSKKIIC